MVLTQVAHWMFAIEYFSTVMRLFYVLAPGLDQQTVVKRKRCLKATTVCLSVVVYSLLVTFYICITFLREETYSFNEYFNSIPTVFSASLLLFSVWFMRNRIMCTQGRSNFYRNERIVAVHAVIFSAYLICFFLDTCLNTIEAHGDGGESDCRFRIVDYSSRAAMWALNLCMIGILDLLSLKYAKPLDNYKDNFVLIFHRGNLPQVTAVERDYGRSLIYNRFVD